MGITVNTESVDVTVDGVTFYLQGDPSGGKAWATLMEMDISYNNAEEREQLLHDLLDALTDMATDDDNAETLRGLFSDGTRGVLTLKKIVEGYISAVTTFPTKPPKQSTRR